jgi:hypothetical protein
VLGVYGRCLALAEQGVPAAALEELDFSAVVQAREATPPDDAGGPRRVLTGVLERLAGLGRPA